MTTPLALVAFAVIVSSVGHRLLWRSRWPDRAPQLGISAWLMLMASAVVSAVLAGVMAAIPNLPPAHSLSHGLSDLLVTCAHAIHQHYTEPFAGVVGLLGAAAAVTVAGRVACGLLGAAHVSRQLLDHQRRHLTLVSRRHELSGALVVEHTIPTVYCTPGRRGEIVVTTAALAALNQDHLDAVLAHERAHLTSRHHMVVLLATGLGKAFPFLPLFATGPTALRRLVEMDADDAAVQTAGRKTLASAILRLSDGGTPAAALGAGNPAAVDRVRRLAAPAQPLGRSATLVAKSVSAVLVLMPLAIITTPMAAAVIINCGLVPG